MKIFVPVNLDDLDYAYLQYLDCVLDFPPPKSATSANFERWKFIWTTEEYRLAFKIAYP